MISNIKDLLDTQVDHPDVQYHAITCPDSQKTWNNFVRHMKDNGWILDDDTVKIKCYVEGE
jgi:hypothetical protein